MKNLNLLLLLCLVLSGCATVTSGDPVVVRAEQTLATSVEVFDAFLKFEYDNPWVKQKSPTLHGAAEQIRKYAPGWIKKATLALRTYKSLRTPESRVAMLADISTLDKALADTQAAYASALALK